MSKSQGWNTKSTKVVWKTQSHITGEWWLGGGGDKKTLQAFFKVRVHAQITFTEYIYIYMYCIYMYIHTEKIFPKEMIKYSRSLLMQWCKEKLKKKQNPDKESIIVLFTAAPGHPIPAYKNIINFFYYFFPW